MTPAKPTVVLVFDEEKDSTGLLQVFSSSDVDVCAHFSSSKVVTDFAVYVDSRKVNALRGKREELVEKVCEVLLSKTQTGMKEVVIPTEDLQFLIDEVQEKAEPEVEVSMEGDFDEEFGTVKKTKTTTPAESEAGEAAAAEFFDDEFTHFTLPIGKREEAA